MSTRTISKSIDLKNQVSKDFVNNNSQATVNKYITQISNGGIKVHDVDDLLNYIQITAGGIEIFKTNGGDPASSISIAQLGETIRLGKQTGSGNVLIDDNSVDIRKGQNVLITVDGDGLTVNDDTGAQVASFLKAPSQGQIEISLSLTYSESTGTESDNKIWHYDLPLASQMAGDIEVCVKLFKNNDPQAVFSRYVTFTPGTYDTGTCTVGSTTYTVRYDSTGITVIETATSTSYTMKNSRVTVPMKVIGGYAVFGDRSSADEKLPNTYTMGTGLIASSPNSLVLGQYNEGGDYAGYAIEVGNGYSDDVRESPFKVSHTGAVICNEIRSNRIEASDIYLEGPTGIRGEHLYNFVTDQGYTTGGTGSNTWYYRRWASGMEEAWGVCTASGVTGSVWASPIYYYNWNVTWPDFFMSSPTQCYIASRNDQWIPVGHGTVNETGTYIRMIKPSSGSQPLAVDVYLVHR